MSSYLNARQKRPRAEDTSNRLVDNPTHARGANSSAADEAGDIAEGRVSAKELKIEADSQFSDEIEIIEDQDATDKNLGEPEDEDADITAQVMGATPGPSEGVEDAFIRGEVDVKEEMDRATKRMDKATGKSRPTQDPTPSL